MGGGREGEANKKGQTKRTSSLVLWRCSCTGLASVDVAMACRMDELV